MTVCLCVRVCAHEVGNVDGVCVSSPFCSCNASVTQAPNMTILYLKSASGSDTDVYLACLAI